MKKFVSVALALAVVLVVAVKLDVLPERIAATLGDAKAQCKLGRMYLDGQGAPQDYTKAVQWFRKAAEQGYPPAQRLYGGMFFFGRGVPKDDANGFEWIRKAGESQDAAAQCVLGIMYANGLRGVQKDDFEAVKWLKKAADQEDVIAQGVLGMMYMDGRGVVRDQRKGCALLKASAERGEKHAINNFNTFCTAQSLDNAELKKRLDEEIARLAGSAKELGTVK